MKLGFVVIARLQSSRLKEKHLLPIDGRPILSYLLERIHYKFKDDLIIATADEPDNQRLEQFKQYGAKVFYGSPGNIPLRLLQTCEALHFDAIVSVDGDDILCAMSAMTKVRDALEHGADYVTTEGLPLGMNVSGYSRPFLLRSLAAHKDDSLETGWGRIFDKGTLTKINFPAAPEDNQLRFTLDYKEDFEFFNAAISHFGVAIASVSDQEIIDYVIQSKSYKLNQSVAKQYWKDFQRNVDREIG